MNTPDEIDENLKCLEGIAARMKELAELPRDADGLIIDEEREDACREEIRALWERASKIMGLTTDASGYNLFIVDTDGNEVSITEGYGTRTPVNQGEFGPASGTINLDTLV